MAVRASTFTRDLDPRGGVQVCTWTGLLNGDTGSPIQASEMSEKTWHAFGTFGTGGTVTIQGSNDGTNWASISTKQGTVPMTLTSTTAINTSQDRPVWVRPSVTAGDGTTSLTMTVACHRFDLPVRD